MSSKMLIDAAHPEETRVVVVRGNRLEEFDYESAQRKQLRGNIYLAKVTRVEPSLQAAFVEYGGNRHGFLAFSEIHPDYYQIPVADRQALLDEEAEDASKAQAEEAAHDDAQSSARGSGKKKPRKKPPVKSKTASPDSDEKTAAGDDALQLESANLTATVSGEAETSSDNAETDEDGNDGNGGNVDSIGDDDALEELPVRRRRVRSYKIQEVIKRRQIILIQVVKEERGNKGAALTTYLSLAGRYTVLMPNTARGGGISRKITNAADRKRLRKIASELEVAKGMGLIIRTAGAARTKAEIKRDYEYLQRMWETIRNLTLQSAAPALVYEEGNLIKRSIRDLYGKEIDAIMVAGDAAYKEAKSFMRLLMPSHAKHVQQYKDPEPIFVRHQIERQLGAMYSPHVTLKSGGYIVINQTEALVSVDVNSGKSTREHSIESTALRTNMEAAEELARQLRLRDMAGLIVIDFIDMEERRNNRTVERKMKDALKSDRARIQLGRISHFGLMEMSRQRLRAGVLEGSTAPCSMCQGSGFIRSTESVALDILRTLEDTLISEGAADLVVSAANEIALYILNQKRDYLRDIEARYGVSIMLASGNGLHGGNFTIGRGNAADGQRRTNNAAVHMDSSHHREGEDEEAEPDQKRRRRRGRRRGRQNRDELSTAAEESNAAETADDTESPAGEQVEAQESGEPEQRARRPRRRGRRGGRRTRGSGRSEAARAQARGGEAAHMAETVPEMAAGEEPAAPTDEVAVGETPKRKPRRASAKTAKPKPDKDKNAPAARTRKRPARKAADDGGDGAVPDAQDVAAKKSASPQPPVSEPDDSGARKSEDESAPRKSGWWQHSA